MNQGRITQVTPKKTSSKNNKTRSGQSFLQGAIILTIGMMIVKVVGALFKIPLTHVIQEYGMGLFNVAYHFYGPIHSLAIAGLPIAISRMVSEMYCRRRYQDVRQIRRVAFPIFVVLGLVGTGAMVIGAPLYCKYMIQNEFALPPMLVLAPAVLFGCLGATFRGYYEGLKNMYPTAISEMIEAASKLIIGLSAAVFISNSCEREFRDFQTIMSMPVQSSDEAAILTMSFAAAGAILGVTIGSLISFIFLILKDRLTGDGITQEMLHSAPRPLTRKRTAFNLVATAVPIAIGSIAINIAGLVDTTFLQSRITDIMQSNSSGLLKMFSGMIPQTFLDRPETIPNFLYGCYSLAFAIYMLVPTITQSLSISALPSITAVWTKGSRRQIATSIESVIRITALIGFPAGLGISALSQPIAQLLFGSATSSVIIGNVLFVLGFAAAIAALSTPISSILQATGRADIPVKMLIIAILMKTGINYVLCGIPDINIYGAAIGTLICYLFLVVSQVIMLCKTTGVRIHVSSVFVKPLISAIICAASAYCSSKIIQIIIGNSVNSSQLIQTLVGTTVGGTLYLVSLLILKGINRHDLLMLPKGENICKILEKRDWI